MRKKRLRPPRRSVKTVSILVLSFAIIAGCSEAVPLTPSPNATIVQEQALKSVKVSIIIKQKLGDPLEHVANVQSSAQFDIIAKAGGDIQKVLKHRGDVVEAGEVIVSLDSIDAKFEREKAALALDTIQNAIIKTKERSRMDMANQKLELSNSVQKMEQGLADLMKNYNKMKNDYDVGLVTKPELYQTEVQLKNTRMDLDQLKQKQNTLEPDNSLSDMDTQLKNAQISMQQVERSLTYLEVRAPESGILTEMPLEAGMTLQPGARVGVIQKLDPIKIIAMLTEQETKLVSGKTELTYYLPGTTEKYKGKVSYLSKVLDPDAKAYEINLEVPNKEMMLKPGMKLWLQLTDEQDQIAVAIPTYSIVKAGDDTFAFVLVGDTVEKRKVQLGRLYEPNQEVLSGVNEGEQVIISNPSQLKDKEKVRLAATEKQK